MTQTGAQLPQGHRPVRHGVGTPARGRCVPAGTPAPPTARRRSRRVTGGPPDGLTGSGGRCPAPGQQAARRTHRPGADLPLPRAHGRLTDVGDVELAVEQHGHDCHGPSRDLPLQHLESLEDLLILRRQLVLGDALQATAGGQCRPGPRTPPHQPPRPLKGQALGARPWRRPPFQADSSGKPAGPALVLWADPS